MVKELGFRVVEWIYYMKPGGKFPHGLVLCWDNENFILLLADLNLVCELHGYIVHAVDVPDVIDKEVNEGQNERVNEGDDGQSVEVLDLIEGVSGGSNKEDS